MYKRWFTGLCLVVAALAIAGCTSPHYLQVDPRVTAEVPRVGNGQQVTVNVVDDRPSEVIGTRSGASMSAATITVFAHDVVPKLQAEVEEAVRRMGFNPTTESADGRPSLTLTLVRMDYARSDSVPVLGESVLETVLQARVVNQGNTYTGTYTARRTQSYTMRPNREANTQMVNDMLGAALDRAFRDPELSGLLAR